MAAKEKDTTAIVPVTERFTCLAKSGDIGEAMRVNFGVSFGGSGDAGMAWTDLERVKMLGGGAPGFEIIDPLLDESTHVDELVVVPVLLQVGRVFFGPWRGEELGGAPDCKSNDGIYGRGIIDSEGDSELRACATCPMSEWGSGRGESQACKSQGLIFVLREGADPESLLPTVLSLPPTSLRVVRKLLMALTARALPYYAAELKISTVTEKNGANKYSRLEAKLHRRLTPDEVTATRAYHEKVVESFSTKVDPTIEQRSVAREATRKAATREKPPVDTEEEIPF